MRLNCSPIDSLVSILLFKTFGYCDVGIRPFRPKDSTTRLQELFNRQKKGPPEALSILPADEVEAVGEFAGYFLVRGWLGRRNYCNAGDTLCAGDLFILAQISHYQMALYAVSQVTAIWVEGLVREPLVLRDTAVASRLAVTLLMISVAILGNTARMETFALYNLEC
ncbi:hypothetical protein BDZ45DRAFT_751743 [Acephala macrosclerotiorum]|nr:hypothetical protein BDZ45DRAFT_751743 [Acephala macrosclerotiorum]